MRDEISAAVLFLARLIEKSENFNKGQLEEFKARLSELLVERFENHWFPDQPFKGQGYRCIRVNERDRRDATLEQAARACGIKYEDMKLPVELTIWVDPNEVCCRFGENKGSYCTLASFSDKENRMVDRERDTEESSAGSEEEEHHPSPRSPAESKDAKSQVSPLSSNNARQGSGGTGKRGSGGSRQKQNGRRNGGHAGAGSNFHHPLQSWYNLISPHWLQPSPPPYHPMLRTRGGPTPAPLNNIPRYHNWQKSPLKV
ncbi:uncharacterized protein LOC142319665 [Lycorma delicatula]|uniref:uncharacterized protein LOC142319665 n=1 Tax=Lycorma delicatula TaxID=130591 RepID=UPI003F50DA98